MILGVDPGGTTGVVLLDPVDPTVLSHSQLDLKSGDDLWAGQLTIAFELADVIAAERFFITARTIKMTRQHDALDVLGALRYLSVIEHKQMRLQSASDAKAAFSDEVLKKLGLFDSVKGPHARDALRHALLAARALYGSV